MASSKKGRTGKRDWIGLYLASKSTSKHGKKALAKASRDFTRVICDCTERIAKGKVKLTAQQLKQAKRHRKKIKQLLSKGSISSKQALLQKGGFGFLLPMLAPAIAGIVGKLFGGQ